MRCFAGRLLGAACLLAAVRLGAQPAAVRVRVVDAATGQPLPSAAVTGVVAGVARAQRYTDAAGEARLPRDGAVRLRARQIGYAPAERDVVAGVDTATLALTRLAYVLADVRVTAESACDTADTDSATAALTLALVERLRDGARRYEAFTRAYPFESRIVRRTGTLGREGRARYHGAAYESHASDDWDGEYEPGRALNGWSPEQWNIPIPESALLGDPAFVTHHCFAARDMESIEGSALGTSQTGTRRARRLDFAPRSTRGTEYQGSALLDSATGVLRRVDYRLVGLERNGVMRRFEGYVTFVEPAPAVAVLDSSVGAWWRFGPSRRGEWGPPSAVQSVRTESLDYFSRRRRPPGGGALRGAAVENR